ncbi:NYN domain-containing protein [Candidatus Daviesbacteria bacterium]|nr:NYN domain-containing protein [Candidatus Daviesbacteria bacterium]
MKKQEKVYAFIDSQNLNLGVRSSGWILDFARFRKYLSAKYKVQHAFLFIGYISKNESLYMFLREAGYKIIFKPTVEGKKKGSGDTKGNVDAELVLHTMIEFPHYDKAIIISGDGDFYCLAEYLDKKDKLAKIIVPNDKYSSLLRRFANYIVSVNLFKNKVKR